MEKKTSQPFLVSSAEAEGIPCDWSCLPSISKRSSHSREKQEQGFALPHVPLTFLEVLNSQKSLLQVWSPPWESRAGKCLCSRLHQASLAQLLIGTAAASRSLGIGSRHHVGIFWGSEGAQESRAELCWAGSADLQSRALGTVSPCPTPLSCPAAPTTWPCRVSPSLLPHPHLPQLPLLPWLSSAGKQSRGRDLLGLAEGPAPGMRWPPALGTGGMSCGISSSVTPSPLRFPPAIPILLERLNKLSCSQGTAEGQPGHWGSSSSAGGSGDTEVTMAAESKYAKPSLGQTFSSAKTRQERQ